MNNYFIILASGQSKRFNSKKQPWEKKGKVRQLSWSYWNWSLLNTQKKSIRVKKKNRQKFKNQDSRLIHWLTLNFFGTFSCEKKYSIGSILKNSLSNNENWGKMWRNPNPKKHYDVIIVGGGGHGLGTAYYLAKHHGIKNIAVIEKGWLGSGNTGRDRKSVV